MEKKVESTKQEIVCCPNCGAALKVFPDNRAYECPVCRRLFVVKKVRVEVQKTEEEENAPLLKETKMPPVNPVDAE